MSPDDFRDHLKRRGYTHIEFAAEMGWERRTVGRMASGKTPIPISVQMLLEDRALSRSNPLNGEGE